MFHRPEPLSHIMKITPLRTLSAQKKGASSGNRQGLNDRRNGRNERNGGGDTLRVEGAQSVLHLARPKLPLRAPPRRALKMSLAIAAAKKDIIQTNAQNPGRAEGAQAVLHMARPNLSLLGLPGVLLSVIRTFPYLSVPRALRPLMWICAGNRGS